MASVQAKTIIFFLKKMRKRALKYAGDHNELRKKKEKIFMRVSASPKSVVIKKFDMEGLEAAKFSPPKVKHKSKVVLYLHGGGYCTGSINSHSGMVGKFTLELGIPHIVINYRLAPEHPFPAGLDDALKAYKWLIEQKNYSPKDIIINGDSAGGGLTLALLLKIKELGLEQPLLSVVFSPWTDLTVMGDSVLNNPEKDPFIVVDLARDWAKWYAGKEDVRHPLVSPLYADVEGLPPMLIHVGTEEILLSDSIQFAAVARKKKVDVTLDIWDEMPHVWHFFWQYLPEAKSAIQKVVDYVDGKIAELS